uniref:Uncharacterized protein n=1 Tax=viral metagenome TaxID=1070528 RepID=A0A6C0DPR3_9ZZZZ
MNSNDINDIRSSADFKGIGFSKYKKADVTKQLLNNMLSGKVEPACYWSAELICAGHYGELWENILHYVGKHIHLGNPKIIIYLKLRFELFKQIMTSGVYATEIDFRNHRKLRQLFAEIITTVTLSNKKNSFESIKINREEEFDMTQLTERLKAPTTEYADDIILKEDPKELFIAVNEFMYHISIKNIRSACYWIEWVIDFNAICKKRKTLLYCQRRPFVNVEKQFSCDIMWILWDGILKSANKTNNEFIIKLISNLIDIFSIKYTTASCKKRRYLFYFAVSILCDTVPTHIELVENKQLVQNVIEQIDNVYKQIKKNEVSPNTDYLYSNLEKKNTLEESMRRLDMVNSLDTFGLSR